ncbi:dynamin family protein [Ornithinibacillus bavariensis]|uniref:dynamin family protein n=1 Tax=Ornithinibacillus bavariensis TaxID=545502 RepID=UPI003D21DA6C
MLRATEQNKTVLTFHNLTGIYHVLNDHGDLINAEKVVDLYQKMQNNEYVVSFAGHFSAGKSSMINALVGSEILPKSPIPTSANIVKLTSGEGVARVFFHHEEPTEYEEPYDLDMIKEYCKDKDTIKKIEISTANSIIPSSCAIIDTPGIDAADDTDRLITESSLHLIDILFYVMDYNHVQSEVNLQFLQTIQAMHIPFYVIINQVDKHNEKELSFQSFEESVKQTFEQWDLSPRATYFTSLVQTDSPYNQFEDVKKELYSLFHDERTLRIDAAVKNLIVSHKEYLQEKENEEIANLLADNTFDENLFIQMESLRDSVNQIKIRPKAFSNAFLHDMDQTLKNAYLMPAIVRDYAESFLESQQKDFKIGFLNAKRKTDEEKDRRTGIFLKNLEETMRANIEWKLREKFSELLKAYSIPEQSLYNLTQQLTVSLTEDDLLSLVKTGAKVNGDYVLNYTNELGQFIKNKYRQASKELLSSIMDFLKKDSELALQRYEAELQQYNNVLLAHKQYNNVKEKFKEKALYLDEQLEHPTVLDETVELIKIKLAPRTFKKGVEILEKQEEIKSKDGKNNIQGHLVANAPNVQQVIHAIDKTIQTFTGTDIFTSVLNELSAKKEKLEHRQYTIALFGAFSAGKSSFANALIGEGILPSSPNPTTAVINRIAPVSEEFSHGTVSIHLKNEETLLQDLLGMVKHFSPPNTNNLTELVNWISENKLQHHPELNHLYQSYLKALLKGYSEHQAVLGKNKTIQLQEFASYVTDESKACFVESIDLYYDCSITRKGITLVDTPGADSINARHTNVAFDYIKNADAILYVTYYNHAITKADKDFVTQLGRVKDAFQMDKMFFLVNAADLAQDEPELNLVLNYVKDQLLKFGIRNPRLYPVSSKISLEEKLTNQPLNRQIATFENDFYAFLENELSQIAVSAAIFDLERVGQQLSHMIKKANLDEMEKASYKISLQEKKKDLLLAAETDPGNLYLERIRQKIQKQLHYVGERIGIRFHDIFKDYFNPTTVTESGRKAMRQLEKNMLDLLDYTGFELLQEARAVSLRVESYLNEQFMECRESYQYQFNQIEKEFRLSISKEIDWVTPEYHQALQKIDLSIFQSAFSLFKGTKAFFEKNEKEKMKDSLYELLAPFIEEYVRDVQVYMVNDYGKQWSSLVERMKAEFMKEINDYIASNTAFVDNTIDSELLTAKHLKVNEILASLNKNKVV